MFYFYLNKTSEYFFPHCVDLKSDFEFKAIVIFLNRPWTL